MIILKQPPYYVTQHADGPNNVFVAWAPAAHARLATPILASLLARALSEDGQLVQFQDLVLLRRGPHKWAPLTNAHVSAAELSRRAYVGTYQPYADMATATFTTTASQQDLPWPELLTNDDRTVLPCLSPDFARYFLGPGYREGIREIEGFYSHPIAGPEPEGFLELFGHDLPAPSAGFPRLRELFSAFDLDPASHCALHTYLLGLFHSDSLLYERPVLFVDSWVRGRGKSEVGRAVCNLVDGHDKSISLSGGGQALKDEIVAHLVAGGRTILGQNLDNKVDFQQELLVSLSTDGVIGSRPKYARELAHFRGVCPIMNGVYGAFSLHPDLLSRVWRCELSGAAQQLHPRPAYYSRERRLEILAEIMAAHAGATPVREATSRCAALERAGLAAYAVAFDLDPAECRRRFDAALAGTAGLATAAVASLARVHRDRFQALSAKFAFGQPTEPDEGARGLGFTFTGGHWNEAGCL